MLASKCRLFNNTNFKMQKKTNSRNTEVIHDLILSFMSHNLILSSKEHAFHRLAKRKPRKISPKEKSKSYRFLEAVKETKLFMSLRLDVYLAVRPALRREVRARSLADEDRTAAFGRETTRAGGRMSEGSRGGARAAWWTRKSVDLSGERGRNAAAGRRRARDFIRYCPRYRFAYTLRRVIYY